MEKRTIIAIAMSFLVIFGWSALVSRLRPPENTALRSVSLPKPSQPSIAPSPATSLPAAVPEEAPETPATTFIFPQDKGEPVFIEQLAIIKHTVFKKYQNYDFSLKSGFLLTDKNLLFKRQNSSSDTALFVHRDKDKQVIKRFIFHNSNYTIDLYIEVQNLSTKEIEFNPGIILGILDFSGDQVETRFKDITVVTSDKTIHNGAKKDAIFENIRFLGLRDHYFCNIIQPKSPGYSAFVRKINAQESEIGLSAKAITIQTGKTSVQEFRIYLGPQELKLINQINPEYTAVLYFGTFDFISHILIQILDWLYGIAHNWGWAIILFSICISLLLYPLSLQQMRSMKQMQVLQPKIEELRKIYKDNPQKLNKEMMDLYRIHKVNPLGGCLPLILQIPVFFALYQAMIRSISLKGAHFLWINDLSQPDRLFSFSAIGPIKEINLLPILMTAIMFIQQKLSMTAVSATANEQQKIMTIIMPVMFLFIFYNMPAGLVLYWLVNSSIMLFNQFKINRLK
ncbi:MAG TPA: membrane protein insertase YidC [Patescibacteria group bacterium]|nr:membrane protein insertase YidC [Patescibacteria group bacterium]